MTDEQIIQADYDDLIDQVEAEMARIGIFDFEVKHIFTPGLYSRTLYIPDGSYLTSKVHKTEHQFNLSQGTLQIYTQDGLVEISAPYLGITMPGTRRFAKAIGNCIFTTYHPTTKTDVDEIEKDVVEVRENKYLTEEREAQNQLGFSGGCGR